MISGKLHNEGCGVAGKRLGLFKHDAGNYYSRHTDKVCACSDPCAAAEQCAGDHSDKRYLCTAGDKCRGHYGHTAVAFVFDGTRCHDTRDTAARADKHRDEGFTGKTELAEDTVEHERDTRHVTAGFQECEEDEQNEHLRDKPEHRADTGDDTVEYQPFEPGSGVRGFKPVADKHGDTLYPHAELCGIGCGKFGVLLGEVLHGVLVGHLDNFFVFAFGFGNAVVINGL